MPTRGWVCPKNLTESDGKGRVRVVYDLGQGLGKEEELLVKSQYKEYTFKIDYEGVTATNYSKVEPESYE